jgi:serine/threonine protein kinase
MSLYLDCLQFGTDVEIYRIIKNGKICITKRAKLYEKQIICSRFLREIIAVQKIQSESDNARNNIIRILDVYIADNYLHYDMEMADGTLYDLVHTDTDRKLVKEMKEKILSDVSKGLSFIHSLGYCYGDLSLRNIVYFKKGNQIEKFALIDFGNMYQIGAPLSVELSTYCMMAPEAKNAHLIISSIAKNIESKKIDKSHIRSEIKRLENTLCDKKSDIWSLGSLSYFLNTGSFYCSDKDIDLMTGIAKQMLISDCSKRPIVYFGDADADADDGRHNTTSLCADDCKKSKYDFNWIDMIVENVAKANGRQFIVNMIDHDVKRVFYQHCCDEEKQMIDKVIGKINMSEFIFSNIHHLIRVVLIWIVAHLYFTDVWPTECILEYLTASLKNTKKIKNLRMNVRKDIETISLEVTKILLKI